jgi:hypothetical protein
MDTTNEDITFLNSEVLLLASDPEAGERILRLLGAHPNVIKRIAAAGSRAVGTAIRCGVPLVTFVPRLDELLGLPVGDLHGHTNQEIPAPLRKLTTTALHVAQRLALIDRTVAQLHFGFTPRMCESLKSLSISRLMHLSERHGVLLRLRTPERPHVWDRLLIGDRCGGPRGFRISQQAGLLSLGNE